MANSLILFSDLKSVQSMLIHHSSAIAPVLGDHKRQTLRELMGVDMLLLDSKVKTEVTLNQGLSHHQFQINVTWKLKPAELDFPNGAMIGKEFFDEIVKAFIGQEHQQQ
ncbi:uncharacterized protein LOC111207051 [Brassica napus]|uniref:uncharacterized protein LOC111207051 n=1 Tax=Brassica napus TaxID=3708 RepID=UPI000BBE7331|nr:uncharacterized protein LOC111207051 [Brassica napus]